MTISDINYKQKFIGLLYVAIFTLSITIIPINIFGYRFFNEPIFIIALINVMILFIFSKFSKNVLNWCIMGLFFSFLFFISFILHLPNKIVFKDFVEALKPLIYCLIASGGVIISTHFREEQVKKYIIIITLASIFFSTFVFFPNLYNLVDIYKGRPSYDDFNIHFYRFSGFMGYPGPFGYWLVFVSLIVVQSFYRKEISFFKFTILYLFLILSIILTGSRGAIVIFALSTIFFTLMNMFFKRNLVFLIMFFLLSLSLLLILKREIQDIEAIKYLVKDVNNIMGSTFAYRFNEIVMVIENFEKGNFFGLGPNNAWFLDNGMPVETAYFFYGYKFGIFGLMFYFSLIFLNFLLFVFSEKHSFSKLFALWSLVILIIGPLSESITEEYKSFYMYFTLLGYCSGNISKNRKKIPM